MSAVSRANGDRIHHPRRHAAVRTDNYVFSQLIPYIGNKRKLLHVIGEALDGAVPKSGTFVDLFAGSTVVGRFAKKRGFRVVANDWEPYSYQIARGTIALNRSPAFDRLKLGATIDVFNHLSNLPPIDDWVSEHLCPVDDDDPDPERERMFFTRSNGRRIDAIRECLEKWKSDDLITDDEFSFVMSSLIYAVSYASNTSGVFKAFHHGWGGKTGTALYRIRGRLRLSPPVLHDNGASNLAVQEDAQTLAPLLPEICGDVPDVVYLDPPYNQHPYGSNYHVLTSVALWDKPPLNPTFFVDGKKVDKSAIRKDWRTERRSAFNHAGHATEAFTRLVDSIDARHIMVSYSTDGNIPLAELLQVLANRGELRVVTQPYKRYRVSSPRMSERPRTVEFVATVNMRRPATPHLVGEIADAIVNEKEGTTSDQRLPLFG